MKFRKALLPVLGLLLMTPAQAMTIRTDVFDENDGTTENPEAGFMEHLELAREFPGRAVLTNEAGDEATCSATYLSKDGDRAYFITAAHCFEWKRPRAEDDADGKWVETASGQRYEIKFIEMSWRWGKGRFDGDIAIIGVDDFEEDLPAARIYCNRNEVGKMATFLSIGRTGTGDSGGTEDYDFGAKYQAGHNMIDAIARKDSDSLSGDETGTLITDFDDGSDENNALKKSDAEPVDRLEFGTYLGDSGGSLWIETEDGWAIAGILSNGSLDGKYGSKSYFARISENKDLLDKYAEANWSKTEDESSCDEMSDDDLAKYFPDPVTGEYTTPVDDEAATDDTAEAADDDDASDDSDEDSSDDDSSDDSDKDSSDDDDDSSDDK